MIKFSCSIVTSSLVVSSILYPNLGWFSKLTKNPFGKPPARYLQNKHKSHRKSSSSILLSHFWPRKSHEIWGFLYKNQEFSDFNPIFRGENSRFDHRVPRRLHGWRGKGAQLPRHAELQIGDRVGGAESCQRCQGMQWMGYIYIYKPLIYIYIYISLTSGWWYTYKVVPQFVR